MEERVREAGLRLLAHRPRSRAELRRRLSRKGFPSSAVEGVLDGFESAGLVDDAAFARAFVLDRVRLKPRGRARLRAELRKRGVAEPVARAAVAEVFEGEAVTDADLAREEALRWLRGRGPRDVEALARPPFDPAREGARRRLHGFLRRRGFRGDAVAAAMAAVDEAVGS